MQPHRALVASTPGLPLRQAHLEREFVIAHAASGTAIGSEVYVLPLDGLDQLVASLPAGTLADRGTQRPKKSLFEYFERRDGLLMLRAKYRDLGQASRGIRALLECAARQQAHARYFIGLDAALFEALWDRAGVRRGAADAPAPGTEARGAAFEELQELVAEHPRLVIPEYVKREFVGNAPCVRLVHYLIVLASRCMHPVLIQGETGTGKEIVARTIHHLQFHGAGKCVCVNCGGIPSELLESELFGHVKGAFTHATFTKIGLWQDAHRGTLFLDEIGDLAPAHQVKVLRACENGTFTPVGAVDPVKSSARVLSATHRSLEAMMRAGRFREDLYYRLVAMRIRTPALREHPEDIPAIARHLWNTLRSHARQELPSEVEVLLRDQPLPGNVRELRSILAGISMLADGGPVTARLARLALRRRAVVERDG